MNEIDDLSYGVYCVDLFEGGYSWRSSCYIIVDEKIAIVETGSPPSNSHILKALDKLNISRDRVDAIIVTHIHLDHSGGTGLLLNSLPNAQVYVHHRGVPHLIDPTKLVASSRIVYGEVFDRLFSPVIPVPKERIVIVNDGDTYEMSSDRVLQFHDSPGHALHHVFIYDPLSRGIFTGDSAGVFYRDLKEGYHVELCVPTTTPTQFDPLAMIETLDKMLSLNPERFYFTHFGMSDKPKDRVDDIKRWLPTFTEKAVQSYRDNPSWQTLAEFLKQSLQEWMNINNIPVNEDSMKYLNIDVQLNAMGIESYIQRMDKQKQK